MIACQVVASPKVDLSVAAVESECQRNLLKELVDKNMGVCSQHPFDYGHTKTVQHEIPLVDTKPFWLLYRKIPHSQWQDVRNVFLLWSRWRRLQESLCFTCSRCDKKGWLVEVVY